MKARALLAAALVLGGCSDFDAAFRECEKAGGCVTPVPDSGAGGGDGGITQTPRLAIDPTVVQLPPIAVGTTRTQHFTVTNSGTGTTGAVSVGLDGGASVFSVLNDLCAGKQLPEAAPCTFDLEFKPGNTVGVRATLVSVTADPGGTITANVSAAGIGAHLKFQALVAFPLTAVGASSTVGELTVTNDGLLPSGALQLTFSTPQFSASGDCAGKTLPVDGTCTLALAYAPTSAGPSTGTLTIGDGVVSAQATLNGSGILAGALAASPNPFDFPEVDVGTSADQQFTVRNTGSGSTGALQLTPPQGPYTFAPGLDGCSSASLAPDAGCAVTVRFAPQKAGIQPGAFSVNDGTSATLPVNFNGKGVDRLTVNVVLAGAGQGTVTIAEADGGSAVTCGPTCGASFHRGSTVALTALAAVSSDFAGWSGDCSGLDASCTLVLGGSDGGLATASFNIRPTMITVAQGGTGALRVVSVPPGLDCATFPCSAVFPNGTLVKLYALPQRSAVTGFSGCAQSGPTSCTLTSGGAITATVNVAPVNVAFTSRQTFLPNLGLTGFDTACTNLARDAGFGIGPGNPGLWRAWASAAGQLAIGRVTPTNGWVLPDGRLVTTGSLLGQPLKNPLLEDETGALLPPTDVAFTGTLFDGGIAANRTCGDWSIITSGTATTGSLGATNSTWTNDVVGTGCGAGSAHLYCFELNNTLPPNEVEVPAGSRYAFVSTGLYLGGIDTPTMDRHCNEEAQDAGLPGNFRTLRSTPLDAGIDGFNPNLPWYRVDGQQLFAGASGFTSGRLMTPLDRDARGAPPVAGALGVLAWTGSGVPSSANLNNFETCSNWTNSTFSASVGAPLSVNTWWFLTTGAQCSAPNHVYCFQQ